MGLLIILSCSNELEEIDGSSKEKEMILKNGTTEFSRDNWANASSEARAKMVRNLFMDHNFIGKQNKYVDDLLGMHTCYIDYEDQPCYELIYDGDYYFLAFYVKHSSNVGEITNIDFIRRD